MEKNKKVNLILTIVFGVLALCTCVFILYQSCLPGTESVGWSDPVTEVVAEVVNDVVPNTINDSNIEVFSGYVRKIVGHYGLFGFQGTLASLAVLFLLNYLEKYSHGKLLLISGGFGVFIAALTEFIQVFIPGRVGDAVDSVVDATGYLLALEIIFIIVLIVKKKKEIKN